LHRFLAARRATREEAEDLLQDLFVKLETRTIGPVAEPLAYLCRMADNLLVDHRRSSAWRTLREDAWTAFQFGSGVDERPTAEQELIARERLEIVSRALGTLPERTLLIFRRFRIQSVSQKEIAAELGISVSAVEKHLQKAYQIVAAVQPTLDADLPDPLRS
jgi:RNA polymerase sigma factor (sigma-70 family)